MLKAAVCLTPIPAVTWKEKRKNGKKNQKKRIPVLILGVAC